MRVDKKKLDLWRAKRCMSSRELENAAKVSSVTLAKIGKRDTNAVVVGKLARALGIEPEELLADE